MVGPRIGEVWADREGREWGPLEANDGSTGALASVYPLVWANEAWTADGVYSVSSRGTLVKSQKDLVRLVRVSEAEAKTAPMDGLTATLVERSKTHGEYKSHARITQALKAVIRTGDTYGQCSDHEKETLDMIAHKIGRIVSGDPHFTDHWHDIAGYARLSEERNK